MGGAKQRRRADDVSLRSLSARLREYVYDVLAALQGVHGGQAGFWVGASAAARTCAERTALTRVRVDCVTSRRLQTTAQFGISASKTFEVRGCPSAAAGGGEDWCAHQRAVSSAAAARQQQRAKVRCSG